MTTFTLLLLSVLALQEDALEKARQLVEARRPLEALHVLDEARRVDPGDARIHRELGALYAALGRVPEALEALGRAVELAPDDEPSALAYGELLYRTGRPSEALPFLQRAASSPDALLLIAGAQEKLGDEEKSMDALSRYVESRPAEIGARLLLGEKLEQAKRTDDALRVYGEGIDDAHPDARLLQRMAELSSRNREAYEDAEAFARRALEASPEILEPRLVLARVLSRTGREEEAIAELERAREQHPEASEVYYNLAQAYQRAGRADDARAAASRFQELSAAEKDAQEREARVAVTYKRAAETLQKGDMLEAEKIFRSVLDIDPENSQVRSMLAKIAFSKNDVAAAKTLINEAMERDPTVAEYPYLRALFDARSGDPSGAEPMVRRALELDPGLPEAWSLLGTLLLDSRRGEESIVCFQRAAVLDPNEASIQLNLASAYASQGREAEEARAMERYRALSARR